jgi:hypothetical protein
MARAGQKGSSGILSCRQECDSYLGWKPGQLVHSSHRCTVSSDRSPWLLSRGKRMALGACIQKLGINRGER